MKAIGRRLSAIGVAMAASFAPAFAHPIFAPRVSAHLGGASAGRTASAAWAQPVCADRAELLAQLAQRFNETPVGVGVTAQGSVVELFVSPAGGTWTIVVTLPSNTSCLVGAGESWQPAPPRPPGRGT